MNQRGVWRWVGENFACETEGLADEAGRLGANRAEGLRNGRGS